MKKFMRLAIAMLIAGCNGLPEDEASQPEYLQYSYVVIGPNGTANARAVSTSDTCPAIKVCSTGIRMQLRAGSGTMPQPPTGHVHDFQALTFASVHPATIISGNGGGDVRPALPSPLPTLAPAPGVTLERVTHSTTFGFMLLERVGTGWTYKAYTAGGKVMATCSQQGRRLLCDRTGRIAA